jgi:PGF-pre-PGF domain-containing protein
MKRIIILLVSIILLPKVVYGIEISSCGVLNQENTTYFLTKDIEINGDVCIEIKAKNVVLDCQGHSISTTQIGKGVLIDILDENYKNVTNVTVKNCFIHYCYYGIYIEGHPLDDNFNASHKIINNTITLSFYGIFIFDASDYNVFINNRIYEVNTGFVIMRHHTSADGNLVVNGSIEGALSYYISSFLSENFFRNTNFSEPRKFIADRSWFVYSNDPNGIPSLYTYEAYSSNMTITRKIISWSRDLVEFNDTGGDSNVTYYLKGLYPNTWYSIYVNGVKVLTEKVNSYGQTSQFFILMSPGETYNIKVINTTVSYVPTLSYPLEYPKDPAIYSYGAKYQFNITACHENGASSISTVLFEWEGRNTTVTTYVPHNSTCRNYTITKADLAANPSGYSYRWYVNDSQNLWASISDSYTITKASPTLKLLLNNEETNKSVVYPTQINVTAYETNLGDSDLSYALYMNQTLIGVGSNVQNISTLNVGFYVYNYNTSGGQNYSSANVLITLTVVESNQICDEGETCFTNPFDCPCPGSPGCCGNRCGCPEGQVCENNVCKTPSLPPPPPPPPQCPQDFTILEEEKNVTIVVKCINQSQTRNFTFSRFLVFNLTLKPNSTIKNFIIKIEKIPESSISENLKINKKVYSYLEFSKENLDEKFLEGIIVRFKVEKAWILAEGINLSTVSLYRLATSWEKLKTYKIGEDSSFIYFESELPSFSIFAIAGEEKIIPPECPVCPAPSDWSECFQGKRERTVYVCSEETNFTCVPLLQEEECEEKKEEKPKEIFILSPFVLLTLIVSFLPSIFLVYYFIKKKKMEEMKILEKALRKEIICPNCNAKMEKTYSGKIMEIYTCKKCGYYKPVLKTQLSEKEFF